MILIPSEDEGAVARKVELQQAVAWRVARGVVQGDSLAEVEWRDVEGFPVEGCQGEVGGGVGCAVGFGGDGPGCVFELFFVDVGCISRVSGGLWRWRGRTGIKMRSRG